MRSIVALSVLAVSSVPASAAPLTKIGAAHTLNARIFPEGAGESVGRVASEFWEASKNGLGRVATKVFGMSAEDAAAVDILLQEQPLADVAKTHNLNAFYKAGQKGVSADAADFFAAMKPKVEAGLPTADPGSDIAILAQIYVKNGDKDILEVVSKMDPKKAKELGVAPSVWSKPGTKVAVAAGATFVGTLAAGSILAEILGNPQPVDQYNDLPATIPNGVLTEDQQKQILVYIRQHPEQYDQILAQLKTTKITPAEMQLFIKANPSQGTVTARSLEDLD